MLAGSTDGGWQPALAVFVLIIVVQLTDGTFLQPMIQSRRVDLQPAVILLGVALAARSSGLHGAHLALPVTTVVSAVYAR